MLRFNVQFKSMVMNILMYYIKLKIFHVAILLLPYAVQHLFELAPAHSHLCQSLTSGWHLHMRICVGLNKAIELDYIKL